MGSMDYIQIITLLKLLLVLFGECSVLQKRKTDWQAAHTIRSFANFGRWEVVEALVNKFDRKDASAFQASELSFFYLHARLWVINSSSSSCY